MQPSLQGKELVAGLIEVVSLGISQNRLDDAETVLNSVRVMRPRLAELDTFDAWIAIKRGFWPDAIRMLRNVDASSTNWMLGKALMAFCQFATSDPEWALNANQVLADGSSPEAIGLVRLLTGDADDPAPAAPQPPAMVDAGASEAEQDLGLSAYLRA